MLDSADSSLNLSRHAQVENPYVRGGRFYWIARLLTRAKPCSTSTA